MTSIDFPSSINQPLLGTHPIAHPSSSTLYWGMPTPIQHSVLSTILCTFGAVGLSGYLFFYRKSNSPWWKKILKFFAGFFLFALMFSATNFHYFTADEFIAIILFLLLWILIVRRKDSVKKQKTDSEVSDTSTIPIGTHETKQNSISDNKNLSDTISQSLTSPTTSMDENPPVHKETTYLKEPMDSKPILKTMEEKSNQKRQYAELNTRPLSFCTYCGEKIEFKSAFCPYCGHRLSSQNKSYKINFNRIFQTKHKINKTKVKKIVKKSCLIVGILAILTGIGIGTWYYFDEIRPEQKAKKILDSETWALNVFAGPLLLDKCTQITRDHDIPTCGDEWRDYTNRMELTQIAWFKIKELAYSGDADAKFELALLYDGYDFEKKQWDRYQYDNGEYQNRNLDYAKAAYWYQQAAIQGHSAAQCNLGVCYEQGNGVIKDIQTAIKWYRLAAANENAFGELHLGDWFEKGEYHTYSDTKWVWEKDPDYFYHDWSTKIGYTQVPKRTYSTIVIFERNMDSAIYYWKRAAAHGNETALERLQKIY